MYVLIDRLLEVCRTFSITISLDKTVVMFWHSPGMVYTELSIYIDDKKMKVIDRFTDLSSTINHFCSVDDEIALGLK